MYSIALQFASIFTLVSIALHNVWSPYLFENYKKKGFINEVRKLYSYIILLLVAISVSLSMSSKELVVLLSNETYIEASTYLTLLCIPMSVYLLFPMASSGISISRETKYIGISYVTGSIINIALLFCLLPYLGIITVPLSLVCSRIITFLMMYKISNSKGIITLPNKMLYILIISVAICYFIVTSDASFILRLSILVVVDAIILAYLIKNANLVSIISKKRK